MVIDTQKIDNSLESSLRYNLGNSLKSPAVSFLQDEVNEAQKELLELEDNDSIVINDFRDSNSTPKYIIQEYDQSKKARTCSNDKVIYMIQMQFIPNNFKRWFFIFCYIFMGIYLVYIMMFTIFQ